MSIKYVPQLQPTVVATETSIHHANLHIRQPRAHWEFQNINDRAAPKIVILLFM
jgi:hypothetical protein